MLDTQKPVLVDFATDYDDEVLSKLASEGSLHDIPNEFLRPADLRVKIASLGSALFADPSARLFPIATEDMTFLSARYAEKCASSISFDVLENINDACSLFNVRPPEIRDTQKTASYDMDAPIDSVDMYDSGTTKTASLDSSKLNPEFMDGIYGRLAVAEEFSEELSKVASLIPQLDPQEACVLLAAFDKEAGLDTMDVYRHIWSPEETIYKHASTISIKIGDKSISLDDLEDKKEVFADYGVDIDYDSDPASIQATFNRLPGALTTSLAKVI